jgi:hypothetical protein
MGRNSAFTSTAGPAGNALASAPDLQETSRWAGFGFAVLWQKRRGRLLEGISRLPSWISLGMFSRQMLSRYSHIRMEAKRKALEAVVVEERPKAVPPLREVQGTPKGTVQ